jgi:hypothetical protein
MVTPERRTSGDLVAVAVIVVAAVAAATLLWRFSDARATESQPAVGAPPAALQPPTTLPPSLAPVWTAPSGATPVPVVAGATVVTADGREVVGRDPFTGEPRWRYARGIDLCTATAAWGNAVTVWSKDPRYCSEVTALAGDTGRRASQRNGDAERGAQLLFDGTHATATGRRYLETWRSDLVRTTQYGAVRTKVNPGKQPRIGCDYVSVAAAAGQIGVVERCPGDGARADRLTVLKANPKDAEQPEVVFSVPLSTRGALLVAMSGQRTAVLLPDPTRLAVFDDKGNQVGTFRVDAPPPTAAGKPANATAGQPANTTAGEPANTTAGQPANATAGGEPAVAAVATGSSALYWFTATSTVALDPVELRPLWTVGGTAGSGVLYAGRLLVPAPGQLVVLDPDNGQRLGATPVDRGGYAGPVRLGAAGAVLLEQRGGVLVALR